MWDRNALEHFKMIANKFVAKYGGNPNFLFAVMAHETGGQMKAWQGDIHNYGGISQQEPNAYPHGEGDGFYRVFKSDEDYIDYWYNGVYRHYPEALKATTIEEFAHIMKKNRYYTADESDYVAGLKSWLKQEGMMDYEGKTYIPGGGWSDTNPVQAMFSDSYDRPWGNSLQNPYMQDRLNQPLNDVPHYKDSQKAVDNSFWSTFKDSFADTVSNNFLYRGAFLGASQQVAQSLQSSDQEVDDNLFNWGKTTLGIKDDNADALEELQWIKDNAINANQFRILVEDKKKDYERERRLEERGWSFARIGGMLAGGALDLVNYIPLGQEAMVGRIAAQAALKEGAGQTIKMLAKYGEKNIAKYAEIGLTNGLINLGEEKANELYGGSHADAFTTFAVGAGASIGLSKLSQMLKGGTKQGKALQTQENLLNGDAIRAIALSQDQVIEHTPVTFEGNRFGSYELPEKIAKRLRGLQKTKEYYEFKTDVEAILDFKTTKAEYDTILDHLAKHGDLDGYTQHFKSGYSIINGVVYDKNGAIAKIHHYPDLIPDDEIPTYFLDDTFTKTAQDGTKIYDWETRLAEKIANGEPATNNTLFYEIMQEVGDKTALLQQQGHKVDEDLIYKEVLEQAKKAGYDVSKFDDRGFYEAVDDYLFAEDNNKQHIFDSPIERNADTDIVEEPPETVSTSPTEPSIDTTEEEYTPNTQNDVTEPSITFSEEPTTTITPQNKYEELLAPNTQDKMYIPSEHVTDPNEIRKETQQAGNTKLGKITQFIETARAFGDISGIFMNSPSDTLRMLGRDLFRDSRQRGLNNGLAVETVKTVVGNEYQPIKDRIYKTFRKYVQEKDFFKLPTDEQSRLWSKDVIDAYHAIYRDQKKSLTDYPQSIQEAVKQLKDFRKKDLQNMVNAGLIEDTGTIQIKDELQRIPDMEKLEWLRSQFKSDEEFKTALQNYFKKAIDVAHFTDKHIDDYIHKRSWTHEDIANLVPNIEAHQGQLINTDTGEILSISDVLSDVHDALKRNPQMMIDDLADKMTNWHLSTNVGQLLQEGDNKLSYWKSRVPLNFDVRMQTPTGIMWNYDDIRMQDLPMLLEYVSNRSSGAIALNQVTGITDIGHDLRELTDKVKLELSIAVDKGYISESTAKMQLDTLQDSLERLTGTLLYPDRFRNRGSTGAQVARIIKDLAYANYMGNAGLNQISEGLGAIALNGMKALTYYIKPLHKLVTDLSDVNLSYRDLDNIRQHVLGYEQAKEIFYAPNTRSYFEHTLDAQGKQAGLLGQVQDVTSFLAKVTSKLNFINPLTRATLSHMQADHMVDLIRFAKGDFKTTMRKNIFSDDKFHNAGIMDIPQFLEKINKYLGSEKVDIEKWKAEDYTSFIQMKAFLQNQSQNIIIQPNIGNTDPWSRSTLGSIMMLFRNFTRASINAHAMRMFNKPEREHVTMLLATALPAGLIWAMRERLNAEERFKGKPVEQKEQYLKDNLSPTNILLAGLLRSSPASGASYLQDAYSVATGSTSYKTTVGTYEEGQNWISNLTQQIAPTHLIMNGGKTLTSTVNDLLYKQELTAKTQQRLYNLFPQSQYIPFRLATAAWADMVDEDKEKKKAVEDFVNRGNTPQTSNHNTTLDQLKQKQEKKQKSKSTKTADDVINKLRGNTNNGNK